MNSLSNSRKITNAKDLFEKNQSFNNQSDNDDISNSSAAALIRGDQPVFQNQFGSKTFYNLK